MKERGREEQRVVEWGGRMEEAIKSKKKEIKRVGRREQK